MKTILENRQKCQGNTGGISRNIHLNISKTRKNLEENEEKFRRTEKL